jgi:hypothetical protein
MSDREKIDQRLKNKIVSAILSYPPDTMSEAEFMADQILAALSHEWRPIDEQRLWLWSLLDEIDTASDMFKSDYEGFSKYVYRRVEERHKIARSDGHSLVFNDVIPLNQPGDGDLMRFNATPPQTEGGEGDG